MNSRKFKYLSISQGQIKLNASTDEFAEALHAVSQACKESGDQGSVIRVSDGFVMFQKIVT
jgi:hypothetical protein